MPVLPTVALQARQLMRFPPPPFPALRDPAVNNLYATRGPMYRKGAALSGCHRPAKQSPAKASHAARSQASNENASLNRQPIRQLARALASWGVSKAARYSVSIWPAHRDASPLPKAASALPTSLFRPTWQLLELPPAQCAGWQALGGTPCCPCRGAGGFGRGRQPSQTCARRALKNHLLL